MNNKKTKKSGVDYSGSSEHLKKKYDVNRIINARLRIFIVILIGLATLLVHRMYVIQIVNADHFKALLEIYSTPPVEKTTKRGDFTDRNDVSLVSSRTVNNIVYFPEPKVKDADEWDMAMKFAQTFEYEFKLTERELKDLYLRLNDNGEHLLTEEDLELIKTEKLKQSDRDRMKRDRVTEDMLAEISLLDQEAFKIYLHMKQAGISASTVYKDAKIEDIAYLAEHQNEFAGFSSTVTWERDYNSNVGLRSIFGSIGSISIEKKLFSEAYGYAGDDIVGESGLEYTYESLLKGNKSVYERDLKTSQLILQKDGQKGNDIRMAIDSQLQMEVERILTDTLEGVKNQARREFTNEIHLVVSDPKTGDILSMAAMKRDADGTYYNDPQAVMLQAYPAGSVVKPATIYMGLAEGAIKPGQVFLDSPMYIKGTKPRASFKNLGSINDLQSLQMSSNIYMFYTAINLAGSRYLPDGPLIFDDAPATFALMRNYFSQFGLGIVTGIDYPGESTGYKGRSTASGSLLEFSIGQYDNYNALQLNQMVSTIANGGFRMKPRLVLDARDRETGQVVYENPITVLNTLDDDMAMGRIREGMRMCHSINNSCGAFSRIKGAAAGKTGTAQANQDGRNMINNAFIGFAPFDNPEIAVACLQPNAYTDTSSISLANLCTEAATKVVESYMNSK